MTRIFGARLEPLVAPVRDLVLPRVVGAATSGLTWSLQRYVDKIRDQDSQKCVGEGLMGGFHVANEGKGRRGSAHGGWTFGRVRERSRRGVDLLDVGTIPEDVIGAVIEQGIYPENPVEEDDPEAIKRESTWDEMREADTHLVDPDCIQAIDPTRINESIDFAGMRGAPTFYCQPVDDAYLRYDGSDIYRGITGIIRGYHAQLVIAATPSELLVLGSWSERFGRAGYAIIDRAFFASGRVTNTYAIFGGPVL